MPAAAWWPRARRSRWRRHRSPIPAASWPRCCRKRRDGAWPAADDGRGRARSRGRGPRFLRVSALELLAASTIVLFQELTLIRWLPGQVRGLANYPNLVLLSACVDAVEIDLPPR